MRRADFLKIFCGGILGTAWGSTWASPRGAEALNAKANSTTTALPTFVVHGPGFGKRIALTYDDGPSPGVTEPILKALEARNLKATFFMIGRKAELYPSLAKEVADAGHEIANHTYTHPQLSRLSDARVLDELRRGQEAIAKATGKEPVWFRPPYGAFRRDQGNLARQEALGVAFWSVDPRDWARPGAAQIRSKILTATRPGAIILLHDLHEQTAEATPGVLDGLLEQYFTFTRLSSFLGRPYTAV